MTTIAPSKPSLGQRVDALDWQEVRAQLDARGFAVTDQILTAAECSELADLFDGGRFRSTIVLVEQRPRAQSRAHVIAPPRGAFVIFPTRERPQQGKRGYHRVSLRHGVSTVTCGQRTALGIIFHDAR